MARSGIWTEADLQRVQQQHGGGRPCPVTPHAPGGILTIDAAGTTGHAYGTPEDISPVAGAFILPVDGSPGKRIVHFQNSVMDLIERHQPTLVVIEAPMRLYAQADRRPDAQRRGNEAAARQQYGLHMAVHGECYRAGVMITEGDVGPVRQAVLGRSKWDHRKEIKPWIVSWCMAMGWDVSAGHDAADACVLWQFACQEVRAGRLRLPVPTNQRGR